MERATLGDSRHRGGERSQAPSERDLGVVRLPASVPGLAPAAGRSRPLGPSLWDPATGRFDPARLRAAIVARGWTVYEFSVFAKLSHETVYRALRRSAVSDRSVVRIVAALETRAPSELIDG